jgi:hypothetical protein
MKSSIIKLAASLALFAAVSLQSVFAAQETTPSTPVLYNQTLNDKGEYADIVINKTPCQYTAEGLKITGNEDLIRLNRYYSLGERLIRYHVKFSADAVAQFRSDTGDFCVIVDVPNQNLSIQTQPVSSRKADFLTPEHEYLLEITHYYQTGTASLSDLMTGDTVEIQAVNNGGGGVGKGTVTTPFFVGSQHDYYCFGLSSGSELLVKQITVLAQESDLTLLIYGDSITEPDGYFPTADYPKAWTELIMSHVKGKSMASGRGGTTIYEVLNRIKNELPYIHAKYVMVTIGTNGGNNEENLSQLVEYILSQGSIPILNNIPSNEHGTQIPVNEQIEKIRQKYHIKGCRFDIPTSLAFDGKEVDKSTMWFENYTNGWGDYFHHPNIKGSRLMYLRTLLDVPEIYE